MRRQAWTSKESELAMIFRSDWGNLALQESGKNWIEQHQKPPWRDLVFGFMWGTPPRKQNLHRAKASRKECQGRAAKAEAKAGT